MVFTPCHSKRKTILPPVLPKGQLPAVPTHANTTPTAGNSPGTQGCITQEISSPSTSIDRNPPLLLPGISFCKSLNILTQKQWLNYACKAKGLAGLYSGIESGLDGGSVTFVQGSGPAHNWRYPGEAQSIPAGFLVMVENQPCS